MTLLSTLVLVLLGAAALAALRALPGTLLHAAAASFAAGAALLGIVGTTMLALGLRVSVLPVYLLTAGLGVIALRRGTSRPRFTVTQDAIARGMLVLVGLMLLVIIVVSLQDRLWWDGWAIWALKGRVLFQDGMLPPAFLDADGAWAFTHLDYPLAVPLVDWWSFVHAGTAAAEVASFLGALWFTLLPALVWSGLRERAGDRVAALAALGITLFWPIAFYATGGTADVVIAVALLGSVIELDRAVTRDDESALPRLAMFLALAALSKNEGIAIALVTVPIALIGLRRTGRTLELRHSWLLLPFAAYAPWWLYVTGHDIRADVITVAGASTLIARLAAFATGLGSLFASVSWIVLPFIAAAGVIGATRQRTPGITAGWFVIGAYFCAIAAAYALSPDDITWLITTSLPRVVGALVPATMLLSAAAISQSPAVKT